MQVRGPACSAAATRAASAKKKKKIEAVVISDEAERMGRNPDDPLIDFSSPSLPPPL